ncbi:very short patch repair endonuclease [Cohnella luojiensis]|uniref:Very short patch repair endonuclease n=1 Tax=Cohnella luojiensis TaxID=652876 RepID=A0A4Y8LX21_9BACL|nr:very short patch repair endonuclease [Cohnella luojiensis]TFE25595.1 very short patch repair endonuclease [Cohnella luojiensis]
MDKVTPETRSKIMKSIKSKSKLEDIVCKELWNRGFRFRRNVRTLMGQPDISISKYKIVIFLDSCFWHYCPTHGHTPLSNVDYWQKKIYKNIKRDILVNSYYEEKGWSILRIWEHQIRNNLAYTIKQIMDFIAEAKQKTMKI